MRYRKKPVEIDAIEMTAEWLASFRDVSRFNPQAIGKRGVVSICHEYADRTSVPNVVLVIREDTVRAFVHTLEGDMKGKIGDFLITGVKGERYFCKPDIFKLTYDPV